MTVDESFASLGLPEHVGCAFAITRKAIDEEGIIVKALPHPDYPHAIYRDIFTDNYFVCRPDENDRYPECFTRMDRIR